MHKRFLKKSFLLDVILTSLLTVFVLFPALTHMELHRFWSAVGIGLYVLLPAIYVEWIGSRFDPPPGTSLLHNGKE